MSEGESRRIEHDLMAEPHIRGRRISVRQVYSLVEERGEDPEAVADRYDLDVADVYHSQFRLTYSSVTSDWSICSESSCTTSPTSRAESV